VVLDEVETIQRMNVQTREKALNALRQFHGHAREGGVAGAVSGHHRHPDFFEGYKGLKGAPALHQRVQVNFSDDPRFDNLRAPQVRLLPFTEDRLLTVAHRVRDLYPAKHTDRVAARVDESIPGGTGVASHGGILAGR